MDLNKYTQKSQEAILNAQQIAQDYGHPTIEPAHLLLALLRQNEGIVPAIVTKVAGSIQGLRDEVSNELNRRPRMQGSNTEAGLAQPTSNALQAAERYAKGMQDDYVSTEHILLGLTESPEGRRLTTFGLTKDAILNALKSVRGSQRVTSAIGASFLRETGLSPDQVAILVNSRKLMNEELQALGVPADQRKEVFRLIDRRNKMEPAEWQAYAREVGLEANQLVKLEAILADKDLWRKSEELRRFFDMVEALGIGPYVRFAPNIVRGLDYYTGIVFEAWDKDGEFRAILGGGRYDNLVSDVGGEPLPATGFAMGDMVVGLVLQKFGFRAAAGPEARLADDHRPALDVPRRERLPEYVGSNVRWSWVLFQAR